MPYITIPVVKDYQISFDDILNGISQLDYNKKQRDTNDTRTVFRDRTPDRLVSAERFAELIDALHAFNERYANIIEVEDKMPFYRSFKIPKKSGGLRPIDAPLPELKAAQYELKYLFESKFFASHHTCAFAYIKKRNPLEAVKRHQENKSKWFLKLDFHNFFGSTTPEFVMSMLSKIYPFNEVVRSQEGRDALRKALSICFLKGGLPQGTPISPMLTNLMMIPIDHEIVKYARATSPHLCYSRYADDIQLSSDLSFKWSEVQDHILDILNVFGAPFTLNKEKTRYGSSAGRNWNLGVMLNKDNEITIGHQKKKVFKAMLFQFCTDYIKQTPWSVEDVQHLQGLKAYYEMVEKDKIREIVATYSAKTGVDIDAAIKEILTQ